MESMPFAAPPSVTPVWLGTACAAVPDPRRAARVIYPLAAILALTVAAILANSLSVLAIAEWGADQDPALLVALGFPEGKTPCQSTLQRLFAKLDGEALAAALLTCFAPLAQPGSGVLQGLPSSARPSVGAAAFPGMAVRSMPSVPSAMTWASCWPTTRS